MSSPAPTQDFVSLFVDLTKNFESPTSFWRWSAYSAIAATLRSNCYLNWGTSKLYPNLYVLLLADSAAYRKDAAPELVEDLLRENAHTKVISGRASWQGIIDELSQDIGNKKTGIPIKDGAGIIIALEFTASFVEDPNLTKMMTEAYSFKEDYDYILRGGRVKIKNRCICLLAGSNETLLRELFGARENYGGLLRRTCLIKPDRRRPPNSLMETTDHLGAGDKKSLSQSLKNLQQLKGEFVLTPEAKSFFKDWYNDLYSSYDKIEDKSGFIQGCHTLIIKLAMVLTAAKGTLTITEATLKQAINEILALKESYATYIMGTGKNPHANMGAMILANLWYESNNGNHPLKRRDILLKYWNEISAEDLDKLLITLESAGLIKIIPQGIEPAWILTDKAKESFQNAQTKKP